MTWKGRQPSQLSGMTGETPVFRSDPQPPAAPAGLRLGGIVVTPMNIALPRDDGKYAVDPHPRWTTVSSGRYIVKPHFGVALKKDTRPKKRERKPSGAGGQRGRNDKGHAPGGEVSLAWQTARPRRASLHFNGFDRAGIDALAAVDAGVADLRFALFHGNGFYRAGGDAGFAAGALSAINNRRHTEALSFTRHISDFADKAG